MGQVNYKSDYAAFPATTSREVEDIRTGEAIESTGKCLRPRARISRALAGALLLSVVCHGIFTIAVSLSPTAVAPKPIQQEILTTPPRVVHLDWDQYHGANEDGSAADAETETTDPNAAPQEPRVAAASASDDDDTAEEKNTSRRSEPKADEPKEETTEDTPDEPATADVESLSEKDDALARLETREQDDTGAGSTDGEAKDNDAKVPATGGSAQGSGNSTHKGIARGPHRREGSSGDGTGKDLGDMRRGHVAQLNRAIRSKNPCTRQLSHRGLSGDVVLGLTQNSDGKVNEVRVLRSSGESLIDEAAKQFVRDQQRLPAPDASLANDVWKIGLRFKCGD